MWDRCQQILLSRSARVIDENGKKHVPIKVHFIGVGILEIPDTQTIIAAKEEIRKNPPSAA